MERERVIVHLDMDAFFGAVEQRDDPELRGKPVIVGADPKGGRGRGVVSTCWYEARRYGVRSAMPISEAWRRCPQGVYVRPRGEAYLEASERVRDVMEEFTPEIEPVSIDEAFLDVTGTLHLFGGKRELARKLASRIEERTQLTASLGVAPCKMVAKIASDLRKPCGLVIVEADEVEDFLRPLPVGRLWGVGAKTREALAEIGVETIGDLAALERAALVERFGKAGESLWQLARGHDDSPVEPPGEAKSVGNEHTFEVDTADRALIEATLMRLCGNVAGRVRHAGLRGRTVTTKVRFEDFTTLTRAKTVEKPVWDETELFDIALANLARADVRGRRLRLLGVTISGFDDARERQTSLFPTPEARPTEDEEKRRRLGQAIDAIRDRFGEDAIHRGTSLRARERQGEQAGDE